MNVAVPRNMAIVPINVVPEATVPMYLKTVEAFFESDSFRCFGLLAKQREFVPHLGAINMSEPANPQAPMEKEVPGNSFHSTNYIVHVFQ